MTPSDAETADTGGAAVADEQEFVRALARGLAVIRAFDADHARLSLSEVARRADVSRASARRSLLTLASLGYVRAQDGAFALTPRVLDLGYGYLSALPLSDVAQPHLDALSRAVTESASVAVLDGAEIVYIARAQSRRIMRVSITIGSRFPAWVTSMGRVLLAALPRDERAAVLDGVELRELTPRTITDRERLDGELDKVARQGWAFLDGELELGLRSLAVPLHGANGGVIGAVNVATGLLDEPDRLLQPLLATARAIDDDLQRH